MKEGKTFILGEDIVKSSGQDAIIAFQDKDEETMNTIYFDISQLSTKSQENYEVRSFMAYAQSGYRNSQGYVKNGVKIILKTPDNYENLIGITMDPFIHEFFIGKNVPDVQKPDFLLQDPSILKHGIVTQRIDGEPKKLDDKLNLSYFSLENPYVNQFILVRTQKGDDRKLWPDTIYQIKQDLKEVSEDRWAPDSEPYLERILKEEYYIHNKKETLFGITTNHLNQYLALNHLLFNDQVKIVILHGGAGTGKTILPYIAGLAQTFYTRGKHSSKDHPIWIQPKFKSVYLTKADNMMGGREIGFQPGDEQDKIAPIMASYEGVHEELICPFRYRELLGLPLDDDSSKKDKGKKRTNPKNLDTRGEYARDNRNPILRPKHSGFLRGVTLRNNFIIVDEAQNFTRKEMKDLIARVGKGSKIVIVGDVIDQIDNPKNSPQVNGLVWAAHGHLGQRHPHVGLMHFTKNERSPVADYNQNIRVPYD